MPLHLVALAAASSLVGATTMVDRPVRAVTPIEEYTIDAGHSIVEFAIGFAFSRVKGRFTQSRGTILYDPTDPTRSSMTIIIDAKSIDTGWPHRDEHLRTDDFFDVDRYPTITFQSERVVRTGQSWRVEGGLTMHGVTKPIAIPFKVTGDGPVRSPESRWKIINAAGTLRIARTAFGIMGGDKHNSWFTKARNATMADSVDIGLEIEAYYADAESHRPAGIVAAAERIRTSGVDAYLTQLRARKTTAPAADWPNAFRGQDFVVRTLIGDDRISDAARLAGALPELFSDNPSAYVIAGYTQLLGRDSAGAAARFTKARDVFRPRPDDPNEKFKQIDDNWYYLDQLVRRSLEWGHLREGAALAKAVTELYPGMAGAYVSYGYALSLTGQKSAAADAFARALQLDPQETRALEYRRYRGVQS